MFDARFRLAEKTEACMDDVNMIDVALAKLTGTSYIMIPVSLEEYRRLKHASMLLND